MAASAAREEALVRTLLVQGAEERDPDGRFLPLPERELASRRAREAAGGDAADPEAFVETRAAELSAWLGARHPALRAASRAALLRVPGVLVLAATSFVGFAADALGGERRVNLLAFPLLALLLWNVAVYVGLAVRALAARRGGAGARTRAGAAALARRLGELVPRAALRVLARPTSAAPDEARWLAAALGDFGRRWLAATGPLHVARMQVALHLGALGFAAGLVAGMYVRGLAWAYRATWESTFLGPGEASALLSFVLGPAARLLDAVRDGAPTAVQLLTPASLAALEAPNDGPAATWIHLWALTAAGAIGVPRAILAALAARRARRLASALRPPLDAPYYLRLLAADRGQGVRVEVLPYSHLLAPRSADALRELLHELFGSRAEVSLRESLAYGDDPPAAAPAPGAQRHVVVFNLAQTPEHEVHGAFLEALRGRA
ncbi:MAG TPA: hypothetical protein VHQ66_12930, partial [Myxococcota bacterium]|nr:hypothetical protein [Myxococcota bacterium]